MLNPLWLLFSIVVWLKKTTSLPKLYININLQLINSNKNIATYSEMLQSIGCEILINSPTRFSLNSKPSLLDHIYTNNVTCDKICGICLYHVSITYLCL